MALHPLSRSRRPSGAVPPAPVELLWQRAQDLAAGLPAFAVRARRLERTAGRGAHGRRRAGAGDAFWQFRPFQSGEPAAAIDWRRSGRGDALYVRQREWETAQNVWLWCERTPSMHFRSAGAGDSKADRAVMLGLAAARLLVDGGERVALYGTHDRAAGGSFGLERLVAGLAHGDGGSAGLPLRQGLPRHAHLVLIGDFLGEAEAMQARLRSLLALGVRGHMLQILDPAEEEFPYRGRIRFEDMAASEALLLARAEDVRAGYRRRMRAWIQTLGTMARRVGWTHSVHRTDHPPALALVALMGALAEGR